MTRSAHQTVAEGVRQYVADWGSLPSGYTVQRVYSVTSALKEAASGTPGAVYVQVGRVDSEKADRSSDDDEILIAVLWMTRLADFETATIDAADLLCGTLRDYLRTLERVAVGASAATRISTALPTPHDPTILKTDELFVSVIECTYRLPVAVA